MFLLYTCQLFPKMFKATPDDFFKSSERFRKSPKMFRWIPNMSEAI